MIESGSHNDQLITQLESVKQWKKLPEFEKRRAIRNFMDAVGHLFLDYFQKHLDEAKASGTIHRALLKSEFDNIYNLYVLNLWLKLENEDEWDDLWETACWGRTNIEAFNTMFGEIVGNLPDEDIVEYMNKKRGKVGVRALSKFLAEESKAKWAYYIYRGDFQIDRERRICFLPAWVVG